MSSTRMVSQHPGSSKEEIENEPDWNSSHAHRIGFVNQDSRRPGLTHGDDEKSDDPQYERKVEEQSQRLKQLQADEKEGKLVNFQEIMKAQPFRLDDPDRYPPTRRFVVDATEDWIKKDQNWPANLEAKQKEEAEAKAKAKHDREQGDDENRWRRDNKLDGTKHNDAYATTNDDKEGSNKSTDIHDSGDEDRDSTDNDNSDKASIDTNPTEDDSSDEKSSKPKTEYQKLRERYSPQEIALLRSIQSEKAYIESLQQNDGKHISPAKKASMKRENTIDVQDQNTPDNWIPRSKDLIRMTGQHPLNAEPKLSALFDAGLITPNQLHYTRNHGAVPRLFWETHKIDVENGKMVLSMNDLVKRFEVHNIPVFLACDGNRRGELNMRKKSKGFSWGSSVASCSYWRGPLLRDILLAAGVPEKPPPGQKRWVNFEGADELAEGKYATCLPLEYVMDPVNDILLAYEMNDLPLPADHGFPVRLLIPGFVGGRNVKWLARIWVSEKENDSYYHIWDNRVLPPFVTEKDGSFAEALFHHPSTAINEQALNSVIVYPAQGESLTLDGKDGADHYRIQGFAYSGGGYEIQRVEVSLDDGDTWLWCVRKFPDYPIRHGRKYWTWIHWYVDVDNAYLFRAKSVTVRCFDTFKNTQPKEAEWNTMGMMNNGWYRVVPALQNDHKTLFWRHPFDIEDNGGGWLVPSVENQLAAAKQNSGIPDKEFTREEVEKHNSQNDCWIVVNNNVYDATSVLKWHPGGASSIAAYAGRLTGDTTTNFESIHDDYAHMKLNECAIGKLTKKAANFIKASAEEEAKKAATGANKDVLLQKKRWTTVTLKDRKKLSEDTYAYIFALREGFKSLGLSTCQHIQIGIHMKDKMLIRSYTPTRPIREGETDGTFELTVKTYLPTEKQPGGAMSNFLLTMPIGRDIEVRGPTGEIVYEGNGVFDIEGKKRTFKRVSLILGGSGVTPGYQLIARILSSAEGGGNEKDTTQLRVIDANKSESDILLHEEMNAFAETHRDQFQIEHVLSHPSDAWKGTKGHVNADIIRKHCFEQSDDSAVFLCGPPAMINTAAMPALKDWGYKEEENMWGF